MLTTENNTASGYHSMQNVLHGMIARCSVVFSCEAIPELLLEKTRKEKTTPFGVNLMRSPVLYRAAQGLKGIEVVSARPIVPPTASSLQRKIAATLLQDLVMKKP